jgi:outer membrane protein assembly factor BamB
MLRPLSTLLLVAMLATGAGADWLRFRGDSTNAAPHERPPTRWNIETGDNVAWKADLPGRGTSSPIVVRGKVMITASSGPRDARLHVLCFDANTGESRWRRQFWATGRTFHHPMTAVATNTPASDGERVYALFSSNDLVCLDLQGNLQWYRGLGFDDPVGNDAGMASCPIVSGDTLIVQMESQGVSFAAGLDKTTGEDRWRIERAPLPNWSSPVLLKSADGPELVLLQSAEKLSAHCPTSGREVWSFANKNDGITSAVVVGNRIYLPTAGAGVRALEIRDGKPQAEWTQNKLNFGAASPVVADGKVLTINRSGVLNCGLAASGEMLWQLRLKGAFWSTPLFAGGHLYAANQEGQVQVIRLPTGNGAKAKSNAKGEVISANDFGESLLSSPAVADNALYYRTDRRLSKIAAPR